MDGGSGGQRNDVSDAGDIDTPTGSDKFLGEMGKRSVINVLGECGFGDVAFSKLRLDFMLFIGIN